MLGYCEDVGRVVVAINQIDDGGCIVGADCVVIADAATIIRATRHGVNLLFKVMSPGKHFAANGLGALAVADALGLDDEA